MNKPALRKQLLQKRLELSPSEWQSRSLQVVDQFKAWLHGRCFDNFILYRSFRQEPDLSSLVPSLGWDRCYYPKVRGKQLVFYKAPVDGVFLINNWGLEEPPEDQSPPLDVHAKTLLVIPALAFDRNYFRLGYGGGYFDRFLAHHSVATVGVCFDAFILPQIPVEPHDIPVQDLITESGFS